MEEDSIIVRIAIEEDCKYAKAITEEMFASAVARGSGIGRRSTGDICSKIMEGKAVVAVAGNGDWAGFSYIEIWSQGEFVSNSGMIVNPAYREHGVAAAIKQKIFDLCRSKFPAAKIFSITTGYAIMKLNARLGFEPVTFNEITKDSKFWEGCKSCVNYSILQDKQFKNCMCTALLFDPHPDLEKSADSHFH